MKDMNRHRTCAMLAAAGALTLTLALALVALLARPDVASAHAGYVSSTPDANATVAVAPRSVTIHFAQHVVPASSDIVVLDAQGKTVSTGSAQANRADLRTMSVPMQGNGSAIYLVQWHTVSADDGHPDIGAFVFRVGKSATPGAHP
jgi:methionine-rich copper-binding protein CopC